MAKKTGKPTESQTNKGRSLWLDVLLVLIMIGGMGLILYPSFADYWNDLHQSRAIASYEKQVSTLDAATYERMWKEAQAYNTKLSGQYTNLHTLTDEEEEEYNAVLDVTGGGIMGYIEIPKINVSLPVYHGTDDAVLQIAVGHIAGSSLPVGGRSTHCVVSGHRGLPSARLFTDLDQLEEGDIFLLQVLDQTLTYEVDQILTVLPEEIDALAIEEGEDYCTLVTCTPYGVNTHRLFVRGHRVDNQIDSIRITADAVQLSPITVSLPTGIMVVTLYIGILYLIGRHAHEKRRRKLENQGQPRRKK